MGIAKKYTLKLSFFVKLFHFLSLGRFCIANQVLASVTTGATIGGGIGFAIGGPIGVAIGAPIGCVIGVISETWHHHRELQQQAAHAANAAARAALAVQERQSLINAVKITGSVASGFAGAYLGKCSNIFENAVCTTTGVGAVGTSLATGVILIKWFYI